VIYILFIINSNFIISPCKDCLHLNIGNKFEQKIVDFFENNIFKFSLGLKLSSNNFSLKFIPTIGFKAGRIMSSISNKQV